MKVVWTPETHQDRLDIWDYIAAESPKSATRMDQLFGGTAKNLGEFPMRGRAGTISGTRELIPHESDCLVYEIAGDTVWVLALAHTPRRWPPQRN